MRWEFKQEPGETHRWRWQYVDADTGSVLKMSPVLFRTLFDCVRDAEKNGYKGPGAPLTSGLATETCDEQPLIVGRNGPEASKP
jgi:hypothetical protein